MATILVVDDHESNRQFLTTLLGYGGHRLLEAADGREALEIVRAEHPALVITDILMPTMDGYEFVRRLRADPALALTNVIFYTAHYREREAHSLAAACGVTHILTKPCEPQEVLQAVNEVLNINVPLAPAVPSEEFDREHRRLLADKLSQKVEELTEANLRLNALTEVGLQLASELDRDRLLNHFCRAARELVSAKYASVALLSEDQGSLQHTFTSGMQAEVVAHLRPILLRQGGLSDLFAQRRAFRLNTPDVNADAIGFPLAEDGACALLCVPIISPLCLYGWLCLQDKVGGTQFSEEEERLICTLASLVGRIHENAGLYAEVRRHEDLLRKLNGELEQRVEERTEELRMVNKELAAFSSAVAHDLRAPLRHIHGFSHILLDEHAAQLDAEGHRYLQQVASATGQMGRLIDDLLSLSRVTHTQLHRETVYLSAVAWGVIKTLRKNQPDRQVEFLHEEGIMVEADARLLRIALENLIGNAWKYTAQQPLAKIEIGQMPSVDGPVYFVRDNGVGFDQTFAEEMFQAFRRLPSALEFEGNGIGLATVQRVIHRHGGRIWAEGELGQGATFYFLLKNSCAILCTENIVERKPSSQ